MKSTTEDRPSGRTVERRLRRIEDRKEQILSAASSVFAEKGYQRATTREIAERANLSEGLIYSYFESKDHLLLAILEKLADAGMEEIVSDGEEPTIRQDVLRKTLRVRHGFLDEMEPMMRATMGEAITNSHFREHYMDVLVRPALESMEKEIDNWVEKGEIKVTDPRGASRFLLAEFIGLFFLRAINEPFVTEKWQEKEFLKQISEYFVDGLRADEAG
jgi:AcrR family transcriptional regulator